MKRDWFKFWTFFYLASWPSFARSALFTVLIPDWRILTISLGEAAYQGFVAVKALDSNPNKPDKPEDISAP